MKSITVVGRAEKLSAFERTLNSYLSEPFRIRAVVPLSADDEAKNFLAYVDGGKEAEDEAYDGMAAHLADGLYEVFIHDSPGEAVEYVTENYEGEAYAPFMDPLTSEEIYKRDVFMGLASMGNISLIRGLLNKKPVAVLVHVSNGHGDNDSVLTPMVILVDEEIGSNLELPFRSSFDS